MRQVSLAVVGIDYPNKRGPGRRFELEICSPGEPVELRAEPKNPYDEHAIAVFSCRDVQLGYLKSERAVWIGTLSRQGRTVSAIFQGLTATAGWVRVAFDSDKPVLPIIRTQEATTDFWPDEIYPDD
jgi:hypothetical protein